MTQFKIGDKVRIKPDAAAASGILPGDFTRGWTVVEIFTGQRSAVKIQRRQGDSLRWFPMENVAHDIDMPWDPPAPRGSPLYVKTLAEKEMEVYERDPVRKKWQQLLGPAPTPAGSVLSGLSLLDEDKPKVKIDVLPFGQSSDSAPIGRYIEVLLPKTFKPGDRVQSAEMTGTVQEPMFSGMVTVRWDGRGAITSIRPEALVRAEEDY